MSIRCKGRSTTSAKFSHTVKPATIRWKKIIYGILITKCKLLHYFKSQSVHMVTSHGLREIVRNRLATGRITKWSLNLIGLDILYVSQMAIKSQALADFIAKLTETEQPPTLVTREHWRMYFDSSFTLNRARGGIVLIYPKGD
jgi:hypothetical protein